MTWASEEQLIAEALSMGLTNTRAFGDSLGSAIAQFESLTGWTPFLSSGHVATEYFTPPRYWAQENLFLPIPFFCIDSVTSYADAGRTGTVLTAGTDYNLITWRFPNGQEAINSIEFLRTPGTAPKSIKIVGQPGAVTDIPADVNEAVKHKALSIAAPGLRGTSEGPVTEVKQGQVSYKVGAEAGRSRAEVWDREFADCVQRYLRISL